MKNTMKRMLCLLLALIMCAGLALGAAAEDDSSKEDSTAVSGSDNTGSGGDEGGGNDNGGDKNDDPVPPVSYGQISIREDSISAFYGDTIALDYTINPENYDGGVTWTSSKEDVATVNNGVVSIAKNGTGEQTVIITAKLDDNGSKSSEDSCAITVRENTVTGFTVSSPDCTISSGGTISLKGRTNFTLEGTTTYASGSADSKKGASWGNIGDIFVVKRENDSGKFVTVGKGTTTVEVICPYDANRKQTLTVTVEDAPLTGLTVSGTGVSNSKATLNTGASLTLTAAKVPANTFNEGAITWSSGNEKIATVDSRGAVKAVAAGSTTITASCKELDRDGKEITIKSSVTVTVSAPSPDISVSTTRGKDLSFSGIYNELISKYNSTYSKNPSFTDYVRFTSLGSSGIGTLYTTSTGSKLVAANTNYTLSEVSKFSFTPSSVGSYEMRYTLTGSEGSVSGKITVSVSGSKTKDITVKLSDDSSAYTFSSSATVGKVSAATAINDAVKDASGKSYSYIVFGTPSSSSSRVGTLYPSSAKNRDLDYYGSYTASSSGTSKQSPVTSLYFEPKKEGDYRISYIAYDSSGVELCSGDLIIEVGASDNATVTVTLDDDESGYTFSQKTQKEKVSAFSAISSAISEETGKAYYYIRFGSVSSGSGVGTLYSNSKKTALSTDRDYYRSTSSTYSVSDLYFVPEKSGTYVRSFTAYDSDNKRLLDGTLKIVVPGESSGSSEMDIYFNTTTGSTISLGEDVFESWFLRQKGSNYKLAFVTFDDVSRSYGTFKNGSASFTPGNDVRYYTDSYTGSTGSSAKYLDNVKFTAGSSVGCVSVGFTCYGGTNTSASSTKLSGVLCIFVTKGSVKSVSYDAASGSSVTLNESDFVTVHTNAMSSSSSSAKYYIELLEVPSKGNLYYGYTSSSKPGTRLTSGNFDKYDFHVNYSSSYDSVHDLTYVPDGSTGTVSVRYLARDTGGESMYVGSISFNCGAAQTASITCGADGYTFRLADFYSGRDSDPVACVIFRQSSVGELMLNYTNGRGVPLDSSVRLYTTSPSSGSYPITALTYIPKAGFSGNVAVDYTTVTESGKTQSGTLTIAVSGKKSSSRFKDVTSSGSGAWASDSIDFAYKWGLVNGTGEDTFSPDSTMSRAMLVTILYRAAGSPKVSGSCIFSDVPSGAYYYDAVIWAAENGIVTGTSATTFSPDRDVNREQVAAFLHRYARYNGENVSVTGTLNDYVDRTSVSSYAIEPVSWAVQRGYITSASSSEKLLSPGGNATRAQVAVMIHRFLTY